MEVGAAFQGFLRGDPPAQPGSWCPALPGEGPPETPGLEPGGGSGQRDFIAGT